MGGSLKDRLIEIADELANDAEFARIAKVTRSAVSQWRKGDVKALKALSAVNIQERTGYSVRWLILGIGPKKVGSRTDLSALTHNSVPAFTAADDKKLLVVLKAFLDTDSEGRDQLVEAAKSVTGANGSGHRDKQPAPLKRRRGSPSS